MSVHIRAQMDARPQTTIAVGDKWKEKKLKRHNGMSEVERDRGNDNGDEV